MKRHGRSFNGNPKREEREAGFCERLCESDGAPSLVEPVACLVVFVWMLSSSWLFILIRECVEACGSPMPM